MFTVQFQVSVSLPEIEKLLRLKKPGLVFVRKTGENGMALKFVLDLPVKGAADVVAREVRVQIGGGEIVSFNLGGDEVITSELEGPEGAEVVGSLVDVDDAGNRSEAREFTAVLTDTIAPPQPGEVGVRVVAEV